MRSKTVGLKQESLKEYEKADSYGDKSKDVGGNFDDDSSSFRFTDIRGPSSMSHDVPTSKIILHNEEERFTAFNYLELLSKSDVEQMPISIADNKPKKKKKKSETIGKIANTST